MLRYVVLAVCSVAGAVIAITAMMLDAQMVARLKAHDPTWTETYSSFDRLRNVRVYTAVFPKSDPLTRRWRLLLWAFAAWGISTATLILMLGPWRH